MSSSRNSFGGVFDGGDFPPIPAKAELAFLDGHYYLKR